ncbi:PREDICTED: uncharacterized protein LOC108688062 [Atta colombica]|uniref:uncharacterized protein LOC108688062 n=1 Tax=Atta colombica TaxID=520822 RepID=UPI00084C85D5|nr:PREDICTED: uncharacterized protein LOC108688062 [Atta colombica]
MRENILDDKHNPHERLKDNSTEKKNSESITSSAKLFIKISFRFDKQKQQIIDSDWGGYALDLDLWEDSKSPVVQIRPSEVLLDDKESFGFLSDRLIGIGSSFLTRSPENGLYILSKCVLKNRDVYTLRYVDLKFNRIADLMEILNLKGFISEIDFRGNSCTKWPNYRNALIASISSVKFIDGVQVLPQEKVASAKMFASPLDLIAVRKAAKLTLLEHININKINPYVQPYDEICPPLMILTGPSALKKMTLALHIAQTIPDKVKYCYWYTTKERDKDKNKNKAFVFLNREEFNNMARRGEFLVIVDLLGDSYGFHVNQISLLISEHKIGLTHMNLYSAVEISKRYPNVKTILVFTRSSDLHRNWIQQKYDIYTWITDSVENLLAVEIGKQEKETETASHIINFIKEILNEIISHRVFPIYEISMKPEENGTITDIKLQNKILPKLVFRRSEIISQKKEYITSLEIKNDIKSFDQLLSEEKKELAELKVLLDEESNIIIEDKEMRQEKHKLRMLQRRNILIRGMLDEFDTDNFSESISSEEMDTVYQETITHEEKAKALKDIYIELNIKNRKLYLDYHESHPGFFVLVLFMDDYTKAFDSLINFIHESYTNLPYKKSKILSEMQHFNHMNISIMLESIIDKIRENLSISKLQRKKILKLQRIDCSSQNNDRNKL